MLRTIAILAAITAAEKQTLMLGSTSNYDSHWSVKCRSRTAGQSVYVEDNYYARFDSCSYNNCRETDLMLELT